MQSNQGPPSNTDYVSVGRQSDFGGIGHNFSNPSRLHGNPYTYVQVSPSYPAATHLGSCDIAAPVRANLGTQITTNEKTPEDKCYGSAETSGNGVKEESIGPVPSSGVSRNPLIRQQVNEMGYSYSCANAPPSAVCTANAVSNSATYKGRTPPPNYPLPSFDELVNPHILSQIHPSPNPSHMAHQGQNYNQSLPEPQTCHATSSRLSNSSSFSVISSDTIQTRLSTAQRRSDLLSAVYGICLQASASYVRSLPRSVSRCGAQRLGIRQSQQIRYQPYALTGPLYSLSRSPRGHNGRERTLIDYISKISTHIWRKARSDPVSPRRAEAVAVREMGDLYSWGEILGQVVEDQDYDYEEERSERDSESCQNEQRILCVGHAAMTLCRWLRDREAWNACQRLNAELKETVREQAETEECQC